MRLLSLLPIGLVLAAVATACSGKLAPETAASGVADASTQADGGVSPRPSDCPATLPAEDTACTKDALLCEYGDDYNPLCNTVRVCSSGRWASPITFGGAAKCPSTVPTVPPNPSGCAATRSAVPEGMACTGTTVCNYDDAQCSCGIHCSNFPIREPDCDADAGRTTSCCDTSKVTWGCFDGPHYCTQPRPRIGSACTEGDSCAIDAPAECGQTTIQCEKGVWNVVNDGCPISTAWAKRDISYVDREQAERLHDELMSVRLARYHYTKGGDDAPHLGFIIEDMPPGSAAVLPSRDRVDLYGYVSMTVASLQKQQLELDALKTDMARLEKENAAMKRRCAAP